MTMAANRLFIDTNILVSAIVPESPRYFHAQGVLERVAASDFETWISRQVLREFLSSMSRHYTTPRRFSTPELLAAAGLGYLWIWWRTDRRWPALSSCGY